MAQTPQRGSTTQPRAAPWDIAAQEIIAPCRGRIINRVLKVLPFQGDDVVVHPTQGDALG